MKRFAILLAALVAGRLYQLQILEKDRYTLLADENRINLRLLVPPRGRILDRFGVTLADNGHNYRLVIVPEQAGDIEATLDALAGRLWGRHGRLLQATGRHSMRAAHTHFIVGAPGHYTVTTHLFDSESPYLDSDAVFGVRDSLVVEFRPTADGNLETTFDIFLTPIE